MSECATCEARGEEITRALDHIRQLEAEITDVRGLREEVLGLRRLRPRIAELELEIACLRTLREAPIQARDS